MNIDYKELVPVIDFWHKSLIKKDLFKREALDEINFSSQEVVDVVGPRRSGKSSLFKLIIDQLSLKDDFLYINFEDPFFIENNKVEILAKLNKEISRIYSTRRFS
jgi:predicted AAA+ superfamily ATPase